MFVVRLVAILVFGGVFLYATIRSLAGAIGDKYARTPAQEWALVGGVKANSAEFRILLSENSGNEPHLLVSEHSNLSLPHQLVPLTTTLRRLGVYSVTVGNLLPETRYYYGILYLLQPTKETVSLPGQFYTPATPGTRYNFTVAVSGCARTGSQHAVFDSIGNETNLQLFIHMGDFHYFDIEVPDLQQRVDAVSTVLNSPPQAALYRSTALAYMWDDHDYIGNNAFTSDTPFGQAVRDVALASYQIAFPHYPLTAPDQTPYQAFTLGTVRFLLADARSEANETTGTVFSDAQREWFETELEQASDYDFVVWVNTKPWVGEAHSRQDSWFGTPQQRQSLSDSIQTLVGGPDGPQNLLMISADAHMLSFDDGTNTYYGTDNNTVLSFPLLHSGPLDRTGSGKGGPYTEGCTAKKYQQNRHYSTISFEAPQNYQDEACLSIDAYRMVGSGKETVFSKRLCGDIFQPSQRDVRLGTCEIDRQKYNDTFARWVSMTCGCILGALLIGSHPYYQRTWMAKEGPMALWVVMAFFLNQKTDNPISNTTALAVAIGVGVVLTIAMVFFGPLGGIADGGESAP